MIRYWLPAFLAWAPLLSAEPETQAPPAVPAESAEQDDADAQAAAAQAEEQAVADSQAESASRGVPVLQDAPWLPRKSAEALAWVRAWLRESAGVGKEFVLLKVPVPKPLPDATDDLPESPNGEAVAVCDGGMLFHAVNNDLVYVHNVRLRETRLHLRAANRLFIRLQKKAVKEGATETRREAVGAARGKHAAVPNQGRPTRGRAAKKAPAPAAAEPAAVVAAPSASVFSADAPLDIRTFDAVVDAETNTVLLFSPQTKCDIAVARGENRMRLTPFADKPAIAMADAAGNIYLRGQVIDLHWADERGLATEVHAEGGIAYYRADTAELVLPGPVRITRPDGGMSCNESLVIQFRMARQKERTKGFMHQFTGMHAEGIARMTARGAVQGFMEENGTKRSIAGDYLVYNGETGDCSLSGAACSLSYGGDTVYSDEGIHLFPNGDIQLLGSNPHGNYERPATAKDAAPLQGTFHAASPLYFHADTGLITAENGIRLADAELDFACTGAAELKLAPREGAAPAAPKGTGNLNLAVARYGEVAALRAEGAVKAHRYDPAAGGACTAMLSGERLDADLMTGAATLTGSSAVAAVAEMEGNHLEAVASPQSVPSLHFAANGDIELSGGVINATLKSQDGPVKASCKRLLKLVRATAVLESGGGTVFRTPHAVVTTRGPLKAHLAEDPHKAAEPAGRWPQHRFTYAGVDHATTASGGTVQTAKGSMQCTGLIELTVNPNDRNADMAGLRTARAEGNVGVAGRDSTGRLIRATGDVLTLDAATGTKRLTGSRVTLADRFNTHIAEGSGAAVVIDAKNNARLTGGRHTTVATHVREQVNKQKQEKPAAPEKRH